MRHSLGILVFAVSALAQGATIEITPRVALIDVPVAIRVSGVAPDANVTLRASATDAQKHEWKSEATFVADAHGIVDVTKSAPLSGSYSGADAMGLFWSMTASGNLPVFARGTMRSYDVTFEALVDGAIVGSANVTRQIVAPDVTVTDVHDGDVVGRYYAPRVTGKQPAILVVTGSNGGIPERYVQLLASHGYAVLAQAFFKAPGLSDELVEAPIEILEHGLKWLSAREEVDPNRLGVLGNSKGGELALLLGSMFPQIKAVVANAPSPFVWEAPAIRKDGVMVQAKRDRSSWSYRGTPLPYLAKVVTPEGEAQMKQNAIWTVGMYAAALDRMPSDQESKAMIPIEKINGPILFVSTKTDALWPADRMSRMAMARLKQRHHNFPDEHLSYDIAGHVIEDAYVPCPTPAGKLVGATAAGTAAAAADSWPRVLRFLERNLRNRKP